MHKQQVLPLRCGSLPSSKSFVDETSNYLKTALFEDLPKGIHGNISKLSPVKAFEIHVREVKCKTKKSFKLQTINLKAQKKLCLKPFSTKPFKEIFMLLINCHRSWKLDLYIPPPHQVPTPQSNTSGRTSSQPPAGWALQKPPEGGSLFCWARFCNMSLLFFCFNTKFWWFRWSIFKSIYNLSFLTKTYKTPIIIAYIYKKPWTNHPTATLYNRPPPK